MELVLYRQASPVKLINQMQVYSKRERLQVAKCDIVNIHTVLRKDPPQIVTKKKRREERAH